MRFVVVLGSQEQRRCKETKSEHFEHFIKCFSLYRLVYRRVFFRDTEIFFFGTAI